MRGILHLIRRDLRHSVMNVMAIIVMFGLVVIPSLFTWFNVLASWNPFDNTKNLTVAVASTDEGYQSDLVPIRVNVGEQVLSQLRANDQLNWVITSEDDAIDGTKAGRYYAAIVLPKSFSADMLTFYADGAERTELAYYTNEKKNALAPKITGQGAEGVSAQISEVFTETLSDVALSLISSLSDYLTDADTQAALTRVESRVGSLAAQLRSGAQTADMFGALVQGTIPLAQSASALVSGAGSAFGDAADAAGSGAGAVQQLAGTLQQATGAIADALAQTAAGYEAVGTSIDDLYAQLGTLSGDQSAALTTLAARVQQQIDGATTLRTTLVDDVRPQLPAAGQQALDDVVAQLDRAILRQQAVHDSLVQAAQDITAGNADAQASHQQVKDLIAQAKDAIAQAQNSYSGTLKPQLDALGSTLATIDDDVSAVRGDLSQAAAGLSGASDSVVATLQGAQGVTARLSTALTDAAGRFDGVQQAIARAVQTGDLAGLSEVIGSDPSVLATSLAEPVRVDRVAVFPVVSFGAGMAPLYIVLALWVGALLMTVAIRVDVGRDTLPGDPDLTPTQKYLGRYGIFALTGLAQSTLVIGGLILFVRIAPAHPFLLLLAGWVTSLVFTLIIYTFVVAFGNAGKALSVLLLVIQISGSGGAYPLQLLPAWFQNISPFLPATHAISAIRSAIAGTYGSDFWVSLGLLLAFTLPTLLLGLVLRRPLISFNRGLVDAMASTKLM
ncbi:YhgE/Pip domain-containing protein [Microbacterium dextranolyticum]|uniref:Phage infection protein n=1 Tax=Microbacterium dextranolyticum TaxID=36806 RepID=A0A9W6M5S2_9MICO|nr:YhgE/Pip domain-containing protein [Microbacterium dextranolyticum]MBM7461569.1 putative membrane protein [Microbacterium dextranolyticum]GLJ94788.1 phage infection protein [Microbacterium dextranolyticum]